MSTWKRVVPEQSRKGDLIEHGSLECQEKTQYRWVNLNPKIDWVCDETTYTKYYKQKKQVSNDYGQTWGDVIPYQYQRGAAYEIHSTDCGYTPEAIYRWTNMDISTDWICDGTTKYYKQKKQVSLDEGQTWQDVTPPEYQKGALYEEDSPDCRPALKFEAAYSGGQTYEKECDGNTALSRLDTRPTGYEYTAMTVAVIGDCVTNIDFLSFGSCYSLTSVTIPNSVTTIGNQAFEQCSGLTSITIPNSVTTIGDWTFLMCYSLASVAIPNSVTSIGNSAFADCTGLTSVTLPNSITRIGDAVFSLCSSLTGITIPNSVTSIGDSAFSNCSGFTNVTIPNSVTSIGYQTFAFCSGLASITIPNSVTSIDEGAFAYCSSLTGITIPTGVTSISNGIFQYCTSLSSVTIPTGVTSIGEFAFSDCSGLTSVTIPDSVTSIEKSAFIRCSGLTSVTCLATTPPTIGIMVFYNTNNCPIYVPANSVNAYKTASGWSDYASRIQPIV